MTECGLLLTQSITPSFVWKDWWKPRKFSARKSTCRPTFESGTSRIWIGSVTASTSSLGSSPVHLKILINCLLLVHMFMSHKVFCLPGFCLHFISSLTDNVVRSQSVSSRAGTAASEVTDYGMKGISLFTSRPDRLRCPPSPVSFNGTKA
jgi:hypothetical protein